MKNCPTCQMSKSEIWGFEVSHVVISFGVLAGSNVLMSIFKAPLFISWGLGIGTLLILRLLSLGQKNGHLELLVRFLIEPHLYLGHAERRHHTEVRR